MCYEAGKAATCMTWLLAFTPHTTVIKVREGLRARWWEREEVRREVA